MLEINWYVARYILVKHLFSKADRASLGMRLRKMDDVIQDVFVRVVQAMRNGVVFDSGRQFASYITKTLDHLLINQWRSEVAYTKNTQKCFAKPFTEEVPLDLVLLAERRRAVRSIVGTLSATKAAAICRYYDIEHDGVALDDKGNDTARYRAKLDLLRNEELAEVAR